MNQGCVFEGEDRRFLGWIVCWMQRLFSYASESPPHWIIRETEKFNYWDGTQSFVRFGVAWPPYVIWQRVKRDGAIVSWPVTLDTPDGLKWIPGSVTMFRAGFRYDSTQKWYIFPSAAYKTDKGWPMSKGF